MLVKNTEPQEIHMIQIGIQGDPHQALQQLLLLGCVRRPWEQMVEVVE